jgi:hypothetical protein
MNETLTADLELPEPRRLLEEALAYHDSLGPASPRRLPLEWIERARKIIDQLGPVQDRETIQPGDYRYFRAPLVQASAPAATDQQPWAWAVTDPQGRLRDERNNGEYED